MGMMMGMEQGTQSPAPTAQGGMMSAPSGRDPNTQAYLQMADAIIQDPTPQTVSRVIDALEGMGAPGTQEIAQALMQVANDPQRLVQLVLQVRQQLGG